jgi:uncharacterized membrane protein
MLTMVRPFLCIALLTPGACQAQQSAETRTPSAAKVEIVASRLVEASDLSADGGSFRDQSNPFWQVEVYRGGIDLNGAASPTPPTMITLPPVRSSVSGDTETWVTQANGEKVQIQAIRERCVRPDGFVFRQKVTVEVGTRILVTCGNRGNDPQATKE